MQLHEWEIKVPGFIDWMSCSVWPPHLNSTREPLSKGKIIDEEMCISGSMSSNIALNFVYQRKRQRVNSVASPASMPLLTDNITLQSNCAFDAAELSLAWPPDSSDCVPHCHDPARDLSVNSTECDRTGPNETVCEQQDLISSIEPLSEGRISDDNYCLLNRSRNPSYPSASGIGPQNATFNFVYKRKRRRKNSIVISPANQPAIDKPTDVHNSATSSECDSWACHQSAACVAESIIGATRSMYFMIPSECNRAEKNFINGVVTGDEAVSEDSLKSEVDRLNCSSSRSYMEQSSTPLNDGVDQCSSSGALIVEQAGEMSEEDVCISILRSRGLLDNINQHTSTGTSSGSYCVKSCTICNRRDSTKNMLLCDDCDGAFHRSCCIPCIKSIPVGEWLCSSCLKRRKMLTRRFTCDSVDKSNGNDKNNQLDCDFEVGSLGYALHDTEPYMSNVRIGNNYQAEVPEWHGPNDKVSDLHGHPLELDLDGSNIIQEQSSLQPVKIASFANWIQCRGHADGGGEGSEGLICGKWRRAPIFEVQTDDWECFCCVSWDPAHADCAAPQEMETEQVLKQLKYMDMLRPRLMEKRRPPDISKRAPRL